MDNCYCTVQDVIDRFQSGYLKATESDPNVMVVPPDDSAIRGAIYDACFTIDVMLAERYPIPFMGGPDAVPKMVRQLCAGIAGTSLGRRWPGQHNNDAWRKDHEEAMKILTALADGFMLLPDCPTLPQFITGVFRQTPGAINYPTEINKINYAEAERYGL